MQDDKPKKLTVYGLRRCVLSTEAGPIPELGDKERATLAPGEKVTLPTALAERMLHAKSVTLDEAEASAAADAYAARTGLGSGKTTHGDAKPTTGEIAPETAEGGKAGGKRG
ncbi:MAG: hypothetical protein KC560_12210 [Myxococcales bacterium]|nr:hypothetical protein [Myxococcales bacterium]